MTARLIITMMRFGILPLGLAIALVSSLGVEARGQVSPVGQWNTINDRDGKPEAVVEVREVNGELSGVVRQLLVAAGPEDSLCGKCTGSRKSQRIIGMEILSHMRRDGGQWSGEILDPENGKTYRATMRLSEDGQQLILRGYIGIPLFGRTQTWIRRTVQDE